jgi:glutamine amidotransferase
VGVVDYGMGNLLSVRHALEMVGADVSICRTPEELDSAGRLILPGVGAFGDCMKRLKEGGLVEALNRVARRSARPILGICLGMQVMACRSEEGGDHEGLGWFDADVVRLKPADGLRVPQIGWNEVEYEPTSPLFQGLPPAPEFYFVHSYWMKCRATACVDASCDYGGPVTAAVRRENMVATQFHPEKSQDYGLKVLRNFLCWNP